MIYVKVLIKVYIIYGIGQFVVFKVVVLQVWFLVCEFIGLEYEYNRLLNLLEYVSNYLI